MTRLRTYVSLTQTERAVVLRSLALLPCVAVLVRTCGLARATSVLARAARCVRAGPDALTPADIARLVNAAASLLGNHCLPRALVLWHFLRGRGTQAEVRVGVAKRPDGSLDAHAWVECDGIPVNQDEDVSLRFAPFGRALPPGA